MLISYKVTSGSMDMITQTMEYNGGDLLIRIKNNISNCKRERLLIVQRIITEQNPKSRKSALLFYKTMSYYKLRCKTHKIFRETNILY